ncbi:MAG: hypothetical protein HYR71_14355, partial [Chloroflexi bacterium]|nr:hypothetical protein [Chloroflexota bacterium]
MILIAFALWLSTLTQRSIWADELGTTSVMAQPDMTSVLKFVANEERRPPLYFVLLYLWTGVAGQHEFALRFFSLFFSALSAATMFALARKMSTVYGTGGRALPLLALFLTIVSPVLALYGVMIRYYALVLFLALMLNLIFVRWLYAAAKPPKPAGGESLALWSTMVIASMVHRYGSLARLRTNRQQTILLWAWFALGLL